MSLATFTRKASHTELPLKKLQRTLLSDINGKLSGRKNCLKRRKNYDDTRQKESKPTINDIITHRWQTWSSAFKIKGQNISEIFIF